MTADNVFVLPNVRSDKAQPPVPVPAHVREDRPSPPSPAARVTVAASGAAADPAAQTSRLRDRVSVSALRPVLEGASLLDAQPPSLAAVWAKQAASASYYSAGLLRVPRYVWGVAVVMPVAMVAYVVPWTLDSPPKAAMTALVTVALLWLLHVI
jgi:hypothetical protein